MGRIGKEIAKRAEAMNNTVAYHSRKARGGCALQAIIPIWSNWPRTAIS
jgi:lactate dehydrogenase-like 2-hydroxyacid dehydrogenase